MKNGEGNRKKLFTAIGLLGAFIIWTVAVCLIDVRAIGPMDSGVGFATLNGFVHRLTGVHMALYTATDLLSLVPAVVVLGFGCLGLGQWIKRKQILKVDADILVLGGFYVVVAAAFLFFEMVVVNYRPVLIEGKLEASYPSSTTMLVMCVMPTAMMQLRRRIGKASVRRIVEILLGVFTGFMVAGRLLSGVHWLTDIIGGGLLSAGLVMLYAFMTEKLAAKENAQ